MGEIRRVYDRVLDREVVRKVLLWDHTGDEDLRQRFLREARVMARLQHPGIPPIHDLGEDEHGRPWMVMREIRGETFRHLMQTRTSSEDPQVRRRRLIGWFARACEAVGSAHAQHVLHRDLKPENIMVGPFGEVQVVDWGLARVMDEPAGGSKRRQRARAGQTQVGLVLGTPGYMAPEQADGKIQRLGPWTDVWALGAILSEILSRTSEISGAPSRDDLDLHQLARACQDPEPSRRLPDAHALASRINDWLEGARRAEAAAELVTSARARLPEIVRMRAQVSSLREDARRAQDNLTDPSAARSPEKEAIWATEDQAAAMERSEAEASTLYAGQLEAALAISPRHEEALDLLADHHRYELEQAEARRDLTGAVQAELRLRGCDRGRHARWLQGDGTITLLTDPPGAQAILHIYQLQGRVLRPAPFSELGQTPISRVAAPRGSWALELRHPRCETTWLPMRLGRLEDWTSGPDGYSTPIVLPLIGELRAREVYVPAGAFLSGGDDRAVDGLPTARVWLDGFILQRFPVTNAEYLDYLTDLWRTGEREEAQARAPRQTRAGSGEREPEPIFGPGPRGVFMVSPSAGPGWEPDLPVTQITWWDARAYAHWLSHRESLPWRLPHALEREKAARGADGRLWPWGDHLDSAWFCNVRGHQATPRRNPVESFPLDESPYGARGLAGNVRDWCLNIWRKDPDWLRSGRITLDEETDSSALREVRGGAWSAVPDFGRPAGRFASAPGDRLGSVGLRLARSIASG